MKFISNSTYRFFLSTFIFIIFFSGKLAGYQQNPVDSIKRVLSFYQIPDQLQEDWTSRLEQASSTESLHNELDRINQKIVDYLKGAGRTNSVRTSFDQPTRWQAKGEKQQYISSSTLIGLLEKGKEAERSGNYEEAIASYEEALSALIAQEKWEKVTEVQEDIADIYAGRLGEFHKALELLQDVSSRLRVLKNGEQLKKVDTKIINLKKRLNITTKEVEKPAELTEKPLDEREISPIQPGKTPLPQLNEKIKIQEAQLAKQQEAMETMDAEMTSANQKLREAEKRNDVREISSLKYTIQKLERRKQKDELAFKEAENELTKQKLKLVQQEAALKEQALAQRSLYGGLGILGLLVFSLFLLYNTKKRDHRKLSAAYEELEVAQEELKNAEQRIKGLLDQHVSGAVAAELLSTKGQQKKERRFVCVLFLDIRNFTPFVESKTPEQIIEYQNNVLGFMMEKIIDHGGIVNTVLGDGFMATFGAPVSSGNDCLQAYKAAVEIMQEVKNKSRTGAIPPTKIGIGLHAGNVVAGNVGTKTRKQYLISGNTVIIASRLEQLNKKYGSTLVISREVVERLPHTMNLPKVFDQVMVKGRSKPVEIAKYS